MLPTLLVAGTSTAAPKKIVKRANLAVVSGSVNESKGVLSGTFNVRNKGTKRAGASSAALAMVVNGKPRILKRYAIPALGKRTSRLVRVSIAAPAGLPDGTYKLRACADSRGEVTERSESDNCRKVGTVIRPVSQGPENTGNTGPPDQPGPDQPGPDPPDQPGPGPPPSTVPPDPRPYSVQTPLHITSASADYHVAVPQRYDSTHNTPYSLLVGLHDCGDTAVNYLDWAVRPYSQRDTQDFIALSVGGRDSGCWNIATDTQRVLDAIADVKTHFNINPRRVVISGYGSGGRLAYHTAFYNANAFAGLLAMMTTPFGSGDDSQSSSIAAAAWKFNIVHIAHTGDTSYPIAGVRSQTQALSDAGFPITTVERPGAHDASSDDALILVGHMADGWLAP
jgi:hypothetical protein